MRTIEQIEIELQDRDLIYKHNPKLGNILDELIAIAKQYRSNSLHDRKAIQAMKREEKGFVEGIHKSFNLDG